MLTGWGSFWKRTHQHQLDLVLQENILMLALFPELFILSNTHWMNYESGSLMIYAKQIWKPYNTYWILRKGRAVMRRADPSPDYSHKTYLAFISSTIISGYWIVCQIWLHLKHSLRLTITCFELRSDLLTFWSVYSWHLGQATHEIRFIYSSYFYGRTSLWFCFAILFDSV